MSETYECDQCGMCCKNMLLEASYLDVLREPRIAERTDNSRDVSLHVLDHTWVLNTRGGCTFLGDDNRCEIYETRPNCCVEFMAGSVRCQEMRKRGGLPPLEPVEDESVLGQVKQSLLRYDMESFGNLTEE